MGSMFYRFSAISMRWKLQLSFFFVTMVTIVINRWVGYGELEHLINIGREHNVNPQVIALLEQRLTVYIQDSFWQSGIEFVVLFLLIGILAGFLVRPILVLCDALDGIEHGDLTREVKVTSQDEVGVLEQRFNAMRIHLNEIMQSLDSSSKQMTNSAFQVSAISHEISEVEEREQNRTGEVMSAMTELQDTLSSVNSMAVEASEVSSQTEETARQGLTQVSANINSMAHMVGEVNRASSQMSELNDSAKQIVDVVNSIHAIAEQTNLLALNAAIEAARAGEQGRGFAVVADEVRSLANRTTASTDQISEIIDHLYGLVQRVSETMGMVVESVNTTQEESQAIADVIEGMANEISRTADSNNNIASVNSEQVQRLNVLQSSLQQLFDTNKENHAKVETTAGIADDLYFVTGNLQKVISEFTFDKTSAVEEFAGSEARQAPRIGYRLRVEVSQDNVKYGGTCLDFSLTGMKLRLAECLNNNEFIEMEIFMPYDDYHAYGSQEPLRLAAKVVWVDSQGDYIIHGINFENVDSSSKYKLQKCIEYFEEDM